MRRRKQSGPATKRAPKGGHHRTTHPVQDEIVPLLTQQAGRDEISEKAVAAGERRRNGKAKTKQPPLSEEMKTVTEIGSRRWKPGQTQ